MLVWVGHSTPRNGPHHSPGPASSAAPCFRPAGTQTPGAGAGLRVPGLPPRAYLRSPRMGNIRHLEDIPEPCRGCVCREPSPAMTGHLPKCHRGKEHPRAVGSHVRCIKLFICICECSTYSNGSLRSHMANFHFLIFQQRGRGGRTECPEQANAVGTGGAGPAGGQHGAMANPWVVAAAPRRGLLCCLLTCAGFPTYEADSLASAMSTIPTSLIPPTINHPLRHPRAARTRAQGRTPASSKNLGPETLLIHN